MYAKVTLALFAVALLAPAGVAALDEVIIPGFGEASASLSQAGVGSDGVTTIIASIAAPTASGAPNLFAGPVTVFAGPSSSGSEAKFQLADGSNVDNKCSFDGTKADCTAVVVKASMTSTLTFESTLPSGAVGFGAGQKKSSASRVAITAGGALVSVGILAGMLL